MATKKKLRVLLTRENNAALAESLSQGGVDVIEIPLIKTTQCEINEDIDDVMREMGSYDWITFSSVNGVRAFFDIFFKKFDDIRFLGIARIACVGEATAAEVRKLHLNVDVVPVLSTAVAMADAMAEYESLDNLKILCVQGNISRPDLLKSLDEKYHAIVDTAVVYNTDFVEVSSDTPAVKDFRKNGADIVVFASPSAVDSFVKNAKSLLLGDKAVHPKIYSIGPTTTEALKKYNMKPHKETADILSVIL